MIVAISGGSGFVGKELVRKIRLQGWEIRTIDRESFSLDEISFVSQKINGADAVIHLAGAPVARKWTPEYKKEILASRVDTTRKITEAIKKAENKPSCFLSASAIGIYNSTDTHTESSKGFSSSFLADVCRTWENEARQAESFTRLVIFRIGMVLGKEGGALSKMEKPFRLGAGAKIGSGNQPVSFIHLHDLVDAIIFVLEHNELSGIINAVSPNPTNNAEFTDTLGKVFRQPAILTVPAFVLRWVYGEGASVMLEGQRVLPEKLLKAGFRFSFPTIRNALVNIFS